MVFDPSMLRVMAITEDLRGNDDRQPYATVIARTLQAVAGGATSVQVRLKGAESRVIADVTRELVQRVPVPVLVNDRFDIALAAGATGVHVGADDIAVADIRRVTPPEFIIGTSVGCDEEIPNASLADFVGIGPVYGTGSKGDAGPAIGHAELVRLARATGKPAIAIGGINTTNAADILTTDVLDAGVVGIAVISAIYAADDPAAATHSLRTLVDAASPDRSRF